MQDLENYKKEKLSVNLVWANVFGFLLVIPIVILFGLPFYFIWGSQLINKQYLYNIVNQSGVVSLVLFLCIVLFGVIVHELIHGMTWAIFAKDGFKSIKFGVLWKMITPYCHCKEVLTVRQYSIGGIMPAIILGIIPAIIGIAIGNLWILLFGMLFTMVAAGDFLIIYLLRKEKSTDLVQDLPSEAGCYIYRKME